jgi:hypothetical protein
VGLFYDALAVTGDQLPNGTSAGNRWIGTYSNRAAQLAGGNADNSNFFFRAGEINPTQISSLNPTWFQPVTAGVTCATGCPQIMFAGRTATELDTKIANGSLAPGGLSGYLLKRFLYNDLLYYPQLAQSSTTLQSFQSSFSAVNGGKLVLAEKTMADAFKLTAQQQTQWNSTASSMESAFQQLVVLDSLAQAGADPETQQTQRDALMQQILTAQTTLQSIWAENLNARIVSVSALQQTLNSVSPQAQWETNEKTLNDIFLNTAFVEQWPTTAQTDQIRQIAEQCFADGGPAVVRARAWYRALTGTQIEVNCGGVIERGVEDQKGSQVQMRISPNPAQNSIWVQFSNPVEQKSRLEIFDMTGRLRKALDIPEKNTAVEIQTAELPTGIYLCRLISEGKLITTEKFSIQR